MTPKRFANAIRIQDPSASNPSDIANTLLDAIREARDEGLRAENCPACRLICYQLAHLFNICPIDHALDPYSEFMGTCRLICHQLAPLFDIYAIDHNPDLHSELMRTCRDHATSGS